MNINKSLPIISAMIITLSSCEKPQDDYVEPFTSPVNTETPVVVPTPTQTGTSTETTQTGTSTETTETGTSTDTQSSTSTDTTEDGTYEQGGETDTEQPPYTDDSQNDYNVNNGYSDAHNYIMANYIDFVSFGNGGDVIAVAPDAQGFDSGEHGWRLMDHAKGVYSNVDYRGIVDTRGAGTDPEFSLSYVNNLESNNTIIHFTATDNAYLGDDLMNSINNMGDNVLNISSLENSFTDQDGSLISDEQAYELQIHGSEDYYIAETGVKLDQTIFVGGLKKNSWDDKYSASVAENHLELFADNMIYVETTGGSSSMGTGTLAGLAAYYASKGLTPQEIIEDIFELNVEYIDAEFYVGDDKWETRTIPAILIK